MIISSRSINFLESSSTISPSNSSCHSFCQSIEHSSLNIVCNAIVPRSIEHFSCKYSIVSVLLMFLNWTWKSGFLLLLLLLIIRSHISPMIVNDQSNWSLFFFQIDVWIVLIIYLHHVLDKQTCSYRLKLLWRYSDPFSFVIILIIRHAVLFLLLDPSLLDTHPIVHTSRHSYCYFSLFNHIRFLLSLIFSMSRSSIEMNKKKENSSSSSCSNCLKPCSNWFLCLIVFIQDTRVENFLLIV